MPRERRGFARLYLGIEATYKHKGGDKIADKVLVEDISVSGMRFISNEILQKETILEISLSIPDLGMPIVAEGKVVWQKRFSESFFETGLEFTSLPQDQSSVLARFISKALGRVEEHRGYVRCNLSTMISYRLTSNPEQELTCLSIDISPSGMKLFVREFMEKGTTMNVSFVLPDDTRTIRAEAIVVWDKRREDEYSEAGIEFTKISEQDTETINGYIKKYLGIQW